MSAHQPTAHHRGGPSTGANADPACRASNQAKEAHGWRVTGDGDRGDPLGGVADAPRVVTWTTPTGHRYTSRRPGPHGHGPTVIVKRPATSPLERRLCTMVRQSRHADEDADAIAEWAEATRVADDPPDD